MLGCLPPLLVLGWWAWAARPAPQGAARTVTPPMHASLWRPWGRPAFRRLLAVFMLNGIASAMPATLVLFFIQDRLQAPATLEPLFLGAYFVCAALSIPLWLRAVGALWPGPHLAPACCWPWPCFVWAAQLGSGRHAGL
jgi:GPH family glycoside/pentoside/hexuronide:cation symporter